MTLEELKEFAEKQKCYKCQSIAFDRLRLVIDFEDDSQYFRIYYCKHCILDLLELKTKETELSSFISHTK